MNKPVYLYNNVYASYDGYLIKLMTGSPIWPTNTIYLDSYVCEALKAYINGITEGALARPPDKEAEGGVDDPYEVHGENDD